MNVQIYLANIKWLNIYIYLNIYQSPKPELVPSFPSLTFSPSPLRFLHRLQTSITQSLCISSTLVSEPQTRAGPLLPSLPSFSITFFYIDYIMAQCSTIRTPNPSWSPPSFPSLLLHHFFLHWLHNGTMQYNQNPKPKLVPSFPSLPSVTFFTLLPSHCCVHVWHTYVMYCLVTGVLSVLVTGVSSLYLSGDWSVQSALVWWLQCPVGLGVGIRSFRWPKATSPPQELEVGAHRAPTF